MRTFSWEKNMFKEPDEDRKPGAKGRSRQTEISLKVVGSARERCVRIKNTCTDSVLNGSGVIVETGLVLTNFHIIEDMGKISVNDNPAELLHYDLRLDLAALTAKTRRLRRVEISTRVYNTLPVFYVGNPDGCNKSVVRGEVSYFSISKKQILSTMPCAEGFSGSGLFDAKTGRLLGIHDSMRAGKDRYDTAIAIPGQAVLAFLKYEVFPRLRQIRKV